MQWQLLNHFVLVKGHACVGYIGLFIPVLSICRIITTEVEVPYTELEVDYREEFTNDEIPIFKTKEVPETISVPVVVEKEVTRMCEEPTGQ